MSVTPASTRKGLRQKARRIALYRLADAHPVEFLDLFWEEALKLDVAGDGRTKRSEWWTPQTGKRS